MQLIKFVCLILAFAWGTGCATTRHFTRLPSPEEFKKPLAQLKQEYPDLAQYGASRLFASIYDMPEAERLLQVWGPPQDTGFSAWLLIPYNWFLNPTDYWYWVFFGKKISALIDRPLVFGYEPHVWTLNIEDLP